jgi:hypothetical protein
MKKFSNMTGEKVSVEPKVEINKEVLERQMMKSGIMKLMDNLLRIQSNGGARTELLESSIRITGKEIFAEALVDLFGTKAASEQIKALESLKSVSGDWEAIDSRIDEILERNDRSVYENNPEKLRKIESFLETYGKSEILGDVLGNHVSRITDPESAEKSSLLASKMSRDEKYIRHQDILKIMSEKYSNRASELYENR